MVPKVQVTVRHGILDQKKDAMNAWIKSISTRDFEVCLQESRTFDGPHSDLSVVCHVFKHNTCASDTSRSYLALFSPFSRESIPGHAV